MATIADRVEAGAEALDRAWPGWHEHLDLEHLDLSMGFYHPDRACGCVLAQLDHTRAAPSSRFGEYEHGLQALMRAVALGPDVDSWTWAWEHGFDATTVGEFQELAEAWRRVVQERREQLVGADP
jgi:hypothetical protein